ncbi:MULTISPECIES: hypothetical protein [unclassified Leptospira]|uniref:hypothetical protein n=1 Tax=unclassified Leptospira TaxID=2633828 RepID=UPI0012F6F09F|nr:MULTISPECIES: hypothetical protein [unclassified Leptospira]MCR1794486.1 hypothetical protein [Leptospira sp. id769339]
MFTEKENCIYDGTDHAEFYPGIGTYANLLHAPSDATTGKSTGQADSTKLEHALHKIRNSALFARSIPDCSEKNFQTSASSPQNTLVGLKNGDFSTWDLLPLTHP